MKRIGNKPLRIVVTALAIAGFGLVVPAVTSSAGTAALSPYVVGLTAPLTGPIALYGQRQLAADKGYFSYVNSHGGVNGHPIKLVSLDDMASATQSIANTIQLITQSHAILMTGIEIDSQCAAVAPTAAQDKVPFACAEVTDGLISPLHPYIFGLNPLNVVQASPMLAAIEKIDVTKKIKSPKIGVIAFDSPGEAQWSARVVSESQSRGWKVVGTQTAALTSNDMSSQAASLSAADPNWVLYDILGPQQVSLIHDMRADGYTGSFIGAGLSFGYPVLSQVADPNNYALAGNDVVTPKTKGAAAQLFVKVMASQGVHGTAALNDQGIVPDYLGAVLIVDGLKRCGTTCVGGAKLVKALAHVELNLPGIVNKFGWTSSDHNAITTYSVYRWNPARNGLVQVLPDELSEGSVSG